MGELERAVAGGVSYDPRMLLSLLLFALLDGERSSRRIERRCRFDARYRLITGGLVPDHNTLARFRRRLGPVLPDLFQQVIARAKERGLVKNRAVALDGTKMLSSASQWKRALEEAEEADADVSDPDARTMVSPKGFVTGYNAQAAVDMETGMVLASEVTNQANDRPHLRSMLDRLTQAVGPPGELAADEGYAGATNAQALHEKGVVGYITESEKVWRLNDQGEVVCPQGHTIRRQGCTTGKPGFRYMRFAVRKCPSCPARCHEGRIRWLKVPVEMDPAVWIAQQERSKSEKGKRMAAARSGTVERFFGNLKGNLGFRRFLLKGLDGANLEFTLACLAYNLRRLRRRLARILIVGTGLLRVLERGTATLPPTSSTARRTPSLAT